MDSAIHPSNNWNGTASTPARELTDFFRVCPRRHWYIISSLPFNFSNTEFWKTLPWQADQSADQMANSAIQYAKPVVLSGRIGELLVTSKPYPSCSETSQNRPHSAGKKSEQFFCHSFQFLPLNEKKKKEKIATIFVPQTLHPVTGLYSHSCAFFCSVKKIWPLIKWYFGSLPWDWSDSCKILKTNRNGTRISICGRKELDAKRSDLVDRELKQRQRRRQRENHLKI